MKNYSGEYVEIGTNKPKVELFFFDNVIFLIFKHFRNLRQIGKKFVLLL